MKQKHQKDGVVNLEVLQVTIEYSHKVLRTLESYIQEELDPCEFSGLLHVTRWPLSTSTVHV